MVLFNAFTIAVAFLLGVEGTPLYVTTVSCHFSFSFSFSKRGVKERVKDNL